MSNDGSEQGEVVIQDALGQCLRFSRAELQALLQRRNGTPLMHLGVSVALACATPLVFALHPSVAMAALCVLVNLHTFNRFAQLVHGSDHAALFTDARWTLWAGTLAGYFLGYPRDGHKAAHNEHHLHLNTELDADRVWCKPEAKVRTLFSGWLRDLFFASAAKRFLQYAGGIAKKEQRGFNDATLRSWLKRGVILLPAALVQGLLVLLYGAGAGVEYYVLLYLLPLATLYPAQIRLRSNVEHAFDPGYQPGSALARKVTRSVEGTWLERFVMAPLYIEYHYEHHILPNMPYYNAPRMRQLLLSKQCAIPLVKGYFAFTWKKWRLERSTPIAAY